MPAIPRYWWILSVLVTASADRREKRVYRRSCGGGFACLFLFAFFSLASSSPAALMAPCPEYRENGACTDDDCPHNHDLRICRPCRIWCQNEKCYQEHTRGKKHAWVMQNGGPMPPVPTYCEVCNTRLPSYIKTPSDYELHVAGSRHQALLQAESRLRAVGSPPAATPDAHCAVCGIDIFERDRTSHELSPGHSKKARFATFRLAFDEAERDKAGVSVEADISFPFLDAPTAFGASVEAARSVAVSFSSTDTGVYLMSARMSSAMAARAEKQYVKGSALSCDSYEWM